MLLFQGVTIKSDSGGKTRRVALFASPRCPGLHYEVEVDRATHLRFQAIMNAELETAAAIGESAEDTDEQEGEHRERARRF